MAIHRFCRVCFDRLVSFISITRHVSQNLPDPRPVQTNLVCDFPIAPALRTQLHNHAALFSFVGIFLIGGSRYGKIERQCTPSGRVIVLRNALCRDDGTAFPFDSIVRNLTGYFVNIHRYVGCFYNVWSCRSLVACQSLGRSMELMVSGKHAPPFALQFCDGPE